MLNEFIFDRMYISMIAQKSHIHILTSAIEIRASVYVTIKFVIRLYRHRQYEYCTKKKKKKTSEQKFDLLSISVSDISLLQFVNSYELYLISIYFMLFIDYVVFLFSIGLAYQSFFYSSRVLLLHFFCCHHLYTGFRETKSICMRIYMRDT